MDGLTRLPLVSWSVVSSRNSSVQDAGGVDALACLNLEVGVGQAVGDFRTADLPLRIVYEAVELDVIGNARAVVVRSLYQFNHDAGVVGLRVVIQKRPAQAVGIELRREFERFFDAEFFVAREIVTASQQVIQKTIRRAS